MSVAITGQTRNHIFLYGPSGSGKTTVGRLLAKNLNLPFLDLDLEIEKQAHSSIPEIFNKEGEPGFRKRESRVFRAVIKDMDRVIALGGGALLNSENYDLAISSGMVVVLQASSNQLSSRLVEDESKRPLLGDDPEIQLRTYLETRAQHYESFILSVDTNDLKPVEVAWEIQKHLGRYHLRGMATQKNPPYDLVVRNGGLHYLGRLLIERGLGGPVVLVTDRNVGVHYLDGLNDTLIGLGYRTKSVVIGPGEVHKNLRTVSRLWEEFLSAGTERGSTVIALGGGVVLDLVGFAAATFMRGVPWVSVPTSLLSMVDAGVGGKTGVDLPQGKNLVGAFHPPRLVLVDPEVLLTLPQVEFNNGMAEVVKHVVIGDPELMDQCRSRYKDYRPQEIFSFLSRAIAVKVKIIEVDPFESGVRAALNFGHTVGHGIEFASGFKCRHGESISIGMVIEAQISEDIGLAQKGLAREIAGKLKDLDLPTAIPEDLDRTTIIRAMKRDKKSAGGKLKFALPIRIGEVKVGVEVEEWEAYLGDKWQMCIN